MEGVEDGLGRRETGERDGAQEAGQKLAHQAIAIHQQLVVGGVAGWARELPHRRGRHGEAVTAYTGKHRSPKRRIGVSRLVEQHGGNEG